MESSSRRLRVAQAQINSVVGDLDGNAAGIAEWAVRARGEGAELVLFPELCLTGYPPEDLLLKRHFLDAAERTLQELASGIEGIVALVGAPSREAHLHNALHVIAEGRVAARYRKTLLPNYGVFDERRYFEPGDGAALIELGGVRLGLQVCEDVWFAGVPTSAAAQAGASLLLNASASPYHRGKGAARERMVAERARENGVAIALCNAVGGQDELVFDGSSFLVGADGETIARAAQFEEELLICEIDLPLAVTEAADPDPAPVIFSTSAPAGAAPAPEPGRPVNPLAPSLPDAEEVYRALRLGLGDYIAKNGFREVVLGLSGGIDSALVALLACDVLDPGGVHCVVMPSPHSSDETQADGRAIAANLGADLTEVPIEPMMKAYEGALEPSFAGTEPGLAEENLQARIRGNIVMALSNEFGWLPLSTGNKSEMSVGYATLYGDMAGGFAVIKDVPKLLVYELVAYRNGIAERELIPASVIERAPSAELRPEQLDSDSLPSYEILDRALEEYVERDGGLESMVAAGIDGDVAAKVIALVDRAEYKRRQAPPGVKITPKAFGRDRRLPITNRSRA